MPDAPAPFLSLAGVSKRYGGVRALAEVDFACRRGSIHAVLGENGAGKSTLIKIIAGVVQPDEGTITLDGEPVVFPTPQAANDAGIVCIFQELSLMPDLSVADNIGITSPPRRLRGHQPADAGQATAAVTAADGGNRQGAGPRPAAADP
jgi:ribose transport system ATP-binding protein